MAHKKVPQKAAAGPSRGAGNSVPRLPAANVKVRNAGREPELTEVDREIIEALTDFRDALHDRAPLEGKYTVRQVVAVVPPPQLRTEDVKKTREALGVSQPIFAGFLGTSPSTVRSWEQGQKPPSPMARRLLGLIAADPSYWKRRFFAMVQPGGGDLEVAVVSKIGSGPSGERSGEAHSRRRRGALTRKGVKKLGDKVTI